MVQVEETLFYKFYMKLYFIISLSLSSAASHYITLIRQSKDNKWQYDNVVIFGSRVSYYELNERIQTIKISIELHTFIQLVYVDLATEYIRCITPLSLVRFVLSIDRTD